MNVLLRNTQTGLFYAGSGQWTSEHEQALTFEAPDSAMDTVYSHQLPPVQVVLHFGDPLFDVPMDIAGLGR